MNKLIEENKLSDISSESDSDIDCDSNSDDKHKDKDKDKDKDQNQNEVFKVKNGKFVATKIEKMNS